MPLESHPRLSPSPVAIVGGNQVVGDLALDDSKRAAD